jgi:hypothetical protein
MKLDQITEKETASVQVSSKKRETATPTGYIGSIQELLNPLKSANFNSELHSFNNFRESKESIEALLKAQSNLVFYVLHQNFMCDDAHKEFFKNMVGRFYDLHEKFWDYYRGIKLADNAIFGLILTENFHLYQKYKDIEYNLNKHTFTMFEGVGSTFKKFNKMTLEEYFGEVIDNKISKYFNPFNNIDNTVYYQIWETRSESKSFKNEYEYGRFQPNHYFIKRKTEKQEQNFWFLATYDWIKTFESDKIDFTTALFSFSVYASLGLENYDKIIDTFKERAEGLGLEWLNIIPKWDIEHCKKIRSLSQTFPWSKEFIFENEDLLNLDVLGLNMTVPWDIDLVKFFVKRGYGGRMSENKAVFDKVFKPLLTDEILDMLFRLEYEKY